MKLETRSSSLKNDIVTEKRKEEESKVKKSSYTYWVREKTEEEKKLDCKPK
jgi:hypothetical protein